MVKHGNAALGELSTAGSDQIQKSKIKIRMSELKRLCEIDIGSDAAGDLLEPLGFKSLIASDDYHAGILTVEVPSFRMKDVCREVDLVEEITRLYGYERLPISMPSNTLAAVQIDPVPGKIRQSLCGSGLSEAWLSSLTSFDDLELRQNSNSPKTNSEKSEQKEQNTEKNDTTVGVLNPLSAEHQVLRQSLIPGLIKAASYNQDRGNASPWLFELGKAYYRSKSEKQQSRLPEHKQTFAREEDLVSGIVVGEPVISSWLDEKAGAGSDDLHRSDSRVFYLIKGIFENLAAVLHIPSGGIKYEDDGEFPSCFHPGRSARIVFSAPETGSDKSDKSEKSDVKKKPGRKGGAITLGFLGELHPAVADDYKLNGRAAALELNVQSLKESMGKQMFAEIFVTPTMQRDLTIDLDNSVKNQDVELTINSIGHATGEETLRRIELVSIFRLSDKKKSLSYRLTFQHASQTLTAESVDAIMAKVREQLSLKLQAEFRL